MSWLALLIWNQLNIYVKSSLVAFGTRIDSVILLMPSWIYCRIVSLKLVTTARRLSWSKCPRGAKSPARRMAKRLHTGTWMKLQLWFDAWIISIFFHLALRKGILFWNTEGNPIFFIAFSAKIRWRDLINALLVVLSSSSFILQILLYSCPPVKNVWTNVHNFGEDATYFFPA